MQGIDDLKIGLNLDKLSFLNLTEMAEILRDDKAIDGIFGKLNETKTFGGSYVLPLLERVEYDVNTIPILFKGL